MVCKWKAEQPVATPGKSLPYWDVCVAYESITAGNLTKKKGFKLLLMHREWWLAHAVDMMHWPLAAAEREWGHTKDQTPVGEQINGGPRPHGGTKER